MTGHYSTSAIPDGITGMIFAMEGIRNTVVLLNGPMGCRFYHSTTSQFLSIHPLLYLPSEAGEKVPVDYNYLNNWFFRQQRVPCTYLDEEDYVFGTAEKVREGLAYLKEHIAFDLLAVVNSPGASLIGDPIGEILKEMFPGQAVVMLESPGFSVDFNYGYEQACLRLLKQNEFLPDRTVLPDGGKPGSAPQTDKRQAGPCVNVIGLSIWNRYFEGDREEIETILNLCGIQVNCFLAADCSLEQIRRIPQADLNLVLDPTRGSLIADYLEQKYGTPAYICGTLPVGFSATETICRELSERLGTDPAELIVKSRKARALAWYKINGIYQSSGLPQGGLFSISADYISVLSYSSFLMEYLGMFPDVLEVTGQMQPSQRRKLEALLKQYHCGQALQKKMEETKAELVFSDANRIGALMTLSHPFCGIEISLPGMGYTDLVKKTHLGIGGALFLTEQVLNGLMTRL